MLIPITGLAKLIFFFSLKYTSNQMLCGFSILIYISLEKFTELFLNRKYPKTSFHKHGLIIMMKIMKYIYNFPYNFYWIKNRV